MFCRGCSGRPKTPTQIPRRVFYQFPTDRRCWATLPFTVKVALRRQGTYFCGILRREADAWAWPVRLVPLDSHNVPSGGVERGRTVHGRCEVHSHSSRGPDVKRLAAIASVPWMRGRRPIRLVPLDSHNVPSCPSAGAVERARVRAVCRRLPWRPSASVCRRLPPSTASESHRRRGNGRCDERDHLS